MSKYIKIYQLFGTYDYTIDFNEKCIVLIGQNGSGKTTILKIINCIFRNNFYELSKYEFEKIELCSGNEICTIEYYDLLPDFSKIPDFNKNLKREDFHYKEKLFLRKVSDYKLEFAKLLSRLHFKPNRENEFLTELIYKFYNCKASKSELNKILEDQLQTEKDIFSDCIAFKYSKYDLKKKGLLFTQSESVEEIKKIMRNLICAEKTCFFNMVNPFNFTTNLNEIVRLKSVELHYTRDLKNSVNDYLIQSVENESTEYYNILRNDMYNTCLNLYINDLKRVCKNLKQKNCKLEYTLKGKTIPLKHLYVGKNRNLIDSIYDDIIEKIESESKIDISSILSLVYFDIETLYQINIELLEALINKYESINNNLEISDDYILNKLREFFLYDKEKKYDWIKPVIIENSPFDTDMFKFKLTKTEISELNEFGTIEQAVEENNNPHIYYPHYYYEHEIIMEFCLNRFPYYKKKRNSRIKKFEKLLSKLLFNKKVEILPAGIRIFSGTNEIELNELSSGEKKVVALAFASLFAGEIAVIIDEPEISISVVLQTMLLPILLKDSELKKILIATHSPFIVDDESMMKYLQSLS